VLRAAILNLSSHSALHEIGSTQAGVGSLLHARPGGGAVAGDGAEERKKRRSSWWKYRNSALNRIEARKGGDEVGKRRRSRARTARSRRHSRGRKIP